MSQIPKCKKCAQPMRQEGRYSEFHCECCDRSARCPHVTGWKRTMRKLGGRKV